MIDNKIEYGIDRKRYKHLTSCPKFSTNQSTNYINERPLKNNSFGNLSFKGLSFCGENQENKPEKSINPTLVLLGSLAVTGLLLRLAPQYKHAVTFSEKEFNEFTKQHLGDIGTNLLDNLKNSKFAKKMIQVDGDKITLMQKTIPQLIWDGLKYPFTILPADILNGSIELLGKIKPLKQWATRVLQKDFFKDIRQRSKIDAKINSLTGIVTTKNELLSELNSGKITQEQLNSKMYQRIFKMFDSSKGAYDTKHERALNRLVSGLPPAIFLANDAYNLSRMMDNDPKKADKEKSTRFKQETVRILSSGYLTLITLGALNKFINNSKIGIMMMTGLTVLATEILSRLMNGKHITRLTPEQARLDNEKNNAPEKNIQPKTASFKANDDNSKEKQQEPLLSAGTLLKASLAVIVAGFGIKGLRKLPAVDNVFKSIGKYFTNIYDRMTTIPDYKVKKEEFDKITETLRKHGFDEIANKYDSIAAQNIQDGVIHLGSKSKKIKPLVNFFIAPFKFIYNTISLPYRYTDKLINLIFKSKNAVSTTEDIGKQIAKDNLKVLANSVEAIQKKAQQKGITAKEFESYVQDNILKGFNSTTLSNVSNSELSNLAKTAATAATLWFLMTDNYNMVMLKSNGNDVSGANTKFKERFVQELSRLFYQTLLIDLFNSTFSSQYNGSLAGMSIVTLIDTTLGEILTRKSVGVPIKKHSREELEQIEKDQNNTTGFLKGYYNFMKRLTGKRSISTYNVDKKGTQEPAKPINFLSEKSVFNEVSSANK